MIRLALLASLVFSGCCFLPYPYTPPDGSVASDAGVALDGGPDDGGATDGGPGSDGGLATCIDEDGGFGPTSERAVAAGFTLPDCAVRGARVEPATPCEARARVLGLWARCSGGLDGSVPLDAPLLELRAESWHLLEVTSDGGLSRRLDLDGSGALGFVEEPLRPARLRVEVQTPRGEWQVWTPAFEEAPDRLRVTPFGGAAVDFARIRVP